MSLNSDLESTEPVREIVAISTIKYDCLSMTYRNPAGNMCLVSGVEALAKAATASGARVDSISKHSLPARLTVPAILADSAALPPSKDEIETAWPLAA